MKNIKVNKHQSNYGAIRVNKKSTLLFPLFMTLVLSGCAGMNSRFDCNVNSGGKCLPMDQVNKMADAGAFNR